VREAQSGGGTAEDWSLPEMTGRGPAGIKEAQEGDYFPKTAARSRREGPRHDVKVPGQDKTLDSRISVGTGRQQRASGHGKGSGS